MQHESMLIHGQGYQNGGNNVSSNYQKVTSIQSHANNIQLEAHSEEECICMQQRIQAQPQ